MALSRDLYVPCFAWTTSMDLSRKDFPCAFSQWFLACTLSQVFFPYPLSQGFSAAFPVGSLQGEYSVDSFAWSVFMPFFAGLLLHAFSQGF